MRRALLLLTLLAAGCQDQNPREVAPQLNALRTYAPDAPPAPEPPYAEISAKSLARRTPVIMYHDVIAKRTRRSQWFDCSAEEFRAQMERLRELNLTPISLRQFYDHLTKGAEVPEGAVVLTFDDNYQGFWDNALPILREFGYPAAMFVHTGYVGDKKGDHPKMTWDELRALQKEGLVTIGSHTITHPDDITTLPEEEQRRELTESKATLERELGVPIEFFAYPNGKNDETTQRLAKEAGYTMAFTIANGLAEESPNLVAVNRYVHTRLETAVEDRRRAVDAGACAAFLADWAEGPVTYRSGKYADVDLRWVSGGKPETMVSAAGREAVGDFVKRSGAQAGVNGTFFAVAAVASTDNQLVGPCRVHDAPAVLPDLETSRWPKLRNRPLVVWNGAAVAISPYLPDVMRDDAAIAQVLPGVTDVFLGGAWLVHDGVARTREQLTVYGSKDVMDARRRAFFGVDDAGRPAAGAATESVSSERFAEALAEAGIREAVLLDSGFSTSLVLGESVLASGHSSPTNPSRPVPHAIVFRGTVDPEGAKLAKTEALPPPRAEEPRRRRRRRDR